MPAWIEITTTLLASRFSQTEWTAFTTAAKAISGQDVITTTIRDVCAEVVGSVLSCPRNAAGTEGTIPPELVSTTLEILRATLASRLPAASIVFDDVRKDLLRAARERLAAVAKCDFYISPPTTSATDSPVPDGGDYGGEDTIDFTPLR